MAILLLFLTGLCVWNLYPPWLVELGEPVPSETDPTGFTFRRVEHHPIFWSPEPLPDAATSKLVLAAEDGTMSMDFRQSHIHWRSLLIGNFMLIAGLVLSLFVYGKLTAPKGRES